MIDTCRLHYQVRGEKNGPVLVFLHGFMGSAADWLETSTTLSRFRCILPDLPGHGRTDPCDSPEYYSMAGAGAALIRMLDELDVDRFTPIGYSMGGRLALYLAVTYSDRCQKVVLESASPGLVDELERHKRRGWDEGRALELEQWEFPRFLTMWYRQPLFEPLTRHQERFRSVLARRRQNDPLELARSMRGMGAGAQPSLWSELEKLDLPVLAIAGELDEKYRKTMGDMVRLCKKGQLRMIPNAGHNVHCETPEPYVQALQDFLTR